MNRLFAAVLAGVVALLGLTLVSAPAGASTTTTTTSTATATATPALDTEVYERKVHRQINKQRKAHGLRKLRFDSCTDRVAENWGSYLASSLEFFHQELDVLFNRCDVTYAGETLAKGPVTPAQMVQLWMESPGHRAILLSSSPRRLGVGAYPDVEGNWVVAAEFTRF